MSSSLQTSDRYAIEREDSGGSSIVYKAMDSKLSAPVAIKAPAPHIANNPKKLAKFVEEAKMLARINNDNVISVLHFYEAGEIDDRCLLVTQWMDRSLAEVLDGESLSPTACMQILHKICSGMFAIHQQDIIHRDIKPENIFLSNDATEVKIGDLGIASDVGMEQTTLTVTPKYTAPENYHQDQIVGRASDIYSLGMIAYEMLLGQAAFQQEFDAIYSVESEKVRTNRWTHWHMNTGARARDLADINPEIPRALSDIVARMMAKELSSRYMDVSEILSDLQSVVGNSVSFVAPLSLEDLNDAGGSSVLDWLKTPMGISVSLAGIMIVVTAILLFPSGKGGTGLAEVNEGIDYIVGLRDKAIAAGADESLASFSSGEVLFREAEVAYEADDYDTALTQLVESEPFYIAAYADAWQRTINDKRNAYEALLKQAEALRVVSSHSTMMAAAEFVSGAEQALADESFEASAEAYDAASESMQAAIASASRVYDFGSTLSEIQAALSVCQQHQRGCELSWYEDELNRTAELTPFELDTNEVTNSEFASFVSATGHVADATRRGASNIVRGFGTQETPNIDWRNPTTRASRHTDFPNAPVVHVSASDAAAYCRWAGKRLPAEAEWEYGARGTQRTAYAWGNEWVNSNLAFKMDSNQPPADVGSNAGGKTASGLNDMTGSVWEWTSTKENRAQIAKGGSRLDGNPANMRAAVRRIESQGFTSNDIGFRCAMTRDSWRQN